MELSAGHIGHECAIIDLFTATFSDSEGAEEGKLIGGFVADLMKTTPQQDLFVFSAYDSNRLVGCIFLSRLTYEEDGRAVFILSPVVVKTSSQKQGIGQKLIAFGLEELSRQGVDIVLTYGDPNYYAKVGFGQISEEMAQAPQKLQQPHGWLGQALGGRNIEPLSGPSRCVAALNRPDLW